MKIGIYKPSGIPESFRVCIENIGTELERLGARLAPFHSIDARPADVDAYWDPRSGGGQPPAAFLRQTSLPCVVTVHGVGPLELPSAYATGIFGRLDVYMDNRHKRRTWARMSRYCDAVIAVSHFGKANIVRHLGLPADRIHVCSNAVNHQLFRPDGTEPPRPRYLLHISNDEKRKNVDRIIAAYRRLEIPEKPELWLKLPPHTRKAPENGIRIISHRSSDQDIAELYRGAYAFIFPSLYEGFGLPILEAMASGCPVITSNSTACTEVAGDAAIKVDPYSVDEIQKGMGMVCQSKTRWLQLRDTGLRQAGLYTWQRSAQAYLAVFNSLLQTGD